MAQTVDTGSRSGGERTTTIPRDVPDLATEKRRRTMRRVALGALTLFVLAGLTGALGVRSTSTTRRSGPMQVTLVHAVVARPALAVPYRLTITREGGFDETIEVRVSTSYLSAFDENGTQPDPDSATSDADETIWEFEPPDGSVFTVWLDTRIEPSVQWRRGGSTTVTHGDETVTIDHPMWVFP